MTVAPKCKVCGRREWGNCTHGIVKRIGQLEPEPLGKVRVAAVGGSRTVLIEIGGNNVTPVTKIGRGRPKRYENAAAKQKAYRARKK